MCVLQGVRQQDKPSHWASAVTVPGEKPSKLEMEEPSVLEPRGGEDGEARSLLMDFLFSVKVELICLFGDPSFLFCEKLDQHKAPVLLTYLGFSHPLHLLPPSPAVWEPHGTEGKSETPFGKIKNKKKLHLGTGGKLVRGRDGSFDGGEQKVVNPHTDGRGQNWKSSSLTRYGFGVHVLRDLGPNQHNENDEGSEQSDYCVAKEGSE